MAGHSNSKVNKPRSEMQTQPKDSIFCQNSVHDGDQRKTYATKKLPCGHAFCVRCTIQHKSAIGDFLKCFICDKQCRIIDAIAIDSSKILMAAREKTCSDIKKQIKDELSQTRITTPSPCEHGYCLNKNQTETVVLGCMHTFCRQCLFRKIKPEISMDEYFCIKCPNCNDDGRWYKHDEFKLLAQRTNENFDLYSKFQTRKASFLDEIQCSIEANAIHLEFKIWFDKEPRTIKVWTGLNDNNQLSYERLPTNVGLYQVDIPIQGDIYFFKISRKNEHSYSMETKWFGPVDLKQGIPPKIDEKIEIDYVSSNSVDLSWKEVKAYKYVKIKGYAIDIWSAKDDNWKPCGFVEYKKNRYTVGKLQRQTKYCFRIRVISSVGEGDSVQSRQVETGAVRGSPSTPHNFRIEIIRTNDANFMWKEPWDTNIYPVLEYVLEMREESTDKWLKVGDVKGKCQIRCPFQKMKDHRNYFFRISSSNSCGKSEPLELQSPVRKLSTPTEPTNLNYELPNNGRPVHVTWNPPVSNGGTSLTGYRITLTEKLSRKQILIKDVANTTFERHLSDLKPGVMYICTVAAKNSIGHGDDAKINITIDSRSDDIIPPPENFKIEYIQDGKDLLVWTHPLHKEKNVDLEYIVQFKEQNSEEWFEVEQTHDCLIFCPYDRMKTNKRYIFQIMAKTARGSSVLVVIDTPVTKTASIFPPPENFKVEYNKDGKDVLVWDHPLHGKKIVDLEYVVQFKEQNSEEWLKVAKTPNCWILCPLERMKTNNGYIFRIFAQTTKERSIPVMIDTPVTKTAVPSAPTDLNVKVLPSSSKSKCSWKQSMLEGGTPAKFVITLKTVEPERIISSTEIDGDKLEYEFENLTNNKYEFSVTGKNVKGTGRSASKTFVIEGIACELPTKPTKVTVSDISACSVILSWEKAARTSENREREFIIEKREINCPVWEIYKTVPSEDNPNEKRQSVTVVNLKDNTEYSFRIAAQNEIGKSPPTFLLDTCVTLKQTGQSGKGEIFTGTKNDEKFDGQNKRKKTETKSCNGCPETIEPLECCLSCDHKYCLACSVKLIKDAVEGFNGNESVYIWTCKCNEMTAEKSVKFIGSELSAKVISNNRKMLQEEKSKIKNGQGNQSLHQTSEVSTQQYKIRGLPNVGMTCYANCIFQILAQTHNFSNHLQTLITDFNLDKDTSITGLLEKVLMDINRAIGDERSSRVDYDTVIRLVDKICQKDQSFARGEQSDSHSFMMTLFNAIKDEIKTETENRCGGTPKEGQLSEQISNKRTHKNGKRRYEELEMKSFAAETEDVVMEELCKEKTKVPLNQFDGFVLNAFIYEPCKHSEFAEKQMFNSLLIPVEKPFIGNWTVSEGLDVLWKEEVFKGNEIPCRQCHNENMTDKNKRKKFNTKTTKRQIFAKLPEVLVLQLGKFEETYWFVTKMYRTVEYKHTLKVKEEQFSQNAKSIITEKTYRLYGVTLHSGTLYGGHYSAYVRYQNRSDNDGEWFSCSDSSISRISEKDVLNDFRASVLFYELIEKNTEVI